MPCVAAELLSKIAPRPIMRGVIGQKARGWLRRAHNMNSPKCFSLLRRFFAWLMSNDAAVSASFLARVRSWKLNPLRKSGDQQRCGRHCLFLSSRLCNSYESIDRSPSFLPLRRCPLRNSSHLFLFSTFKQLLVPWRQSSSAVVFKREEGKARNKSVKLANVVRTARMTWSGRARMKNL